jgi:hypothetical protein
MDNQESKVAHRDRIVEMLAGAIRHTALLCCPAIQGFVEEVTSKEALDRTDSFGKIRERKRGGKAESNLLLAVEKLYGLRASNAWIASRDYEGLLILLWHGVGETLDLENFAKGERFSGDGPLQGETQRYLDSVIRPLILASFEIVWAMDKERKKVQVKERKLRKLIESKL